MPSEIAQRLSHLFDSMFELMQDRADEDDDLLHEIDRTLNAAEPDFSNARIIANKILARAVYAGDANDVTQAAERVRAILSQWRNAERDWGRDYELEEVSWISEHAMEISEWSQQVRERIELIQ